LTADNHACARCAIGSEGNGGLEIAKHLQIGRASLDRALQPALQGDSRICATPGTDKLSGKRAKLAAIMQRGCNAHEESTLTKLSRCLNFRMDLEELESAVVNPNGAYVDGEILETGRYKTQTGASRKAKA